MKMPWTDQTGLAKAAAIFGCIFGVSFGLCGINFIAFSVGVNSQVASNSLAMAGYLELLGMVIGFVGLVVIVLIWLVLTLVSIFRR